MITTLRLLVVGRCFEIRHSRRENDVPLYLRYKEEMLSSELLAASSINTQ